MRLKFQFTIALFCILPVILQAQTATMFSPTTGSSTGTGGNTSANSTSNGTDTGLQGKASGEAVQIRQGFLYPKDKTSVFMPSNTTTTSNSRTSRHEHDHSWHNRCSILEFEFSGPSWWREQLWIGKPIRSRNPKWCQRHGFDTGTAHSHANDEHHSFARTRSGCGRHKIPAAG